MERKMEREEVNELGEEGGEGKRGGRDESMRCVHALLNRAYLQGLHDIPEAGPLMVSLLPTSVAVAFCGQLLDEAIRYFTVLAVQQLRGEKEEEGGKRRG